jgi:diguanylate cyclase (GGDEF)-like protein
MVKFLKSCSRLFALAVAMWVVTLPAAGAERWAGLVDTVFTQIVRPHEFPTTSGATAIAQDGEGFIWVASQVGLARWDGYHFRAYQPAIDVPGSLPDNYITALHTDAKGQLWIATNSAGLARYDRRCDCFATYTVGANGLSHVSVNAIEDDGAGGLWVGTVGGLDRLDPAKGVIERIRHAVGDPASLPNDRIQSLQRDRQGRLWVGTGSGLARMSADGIRFSQIPLPGKSGQAPQVLTLFEDANGRMWAGTRGDGAYVIEANQSMARAVRETRAGPSPLADETVRSIGEIRPGVVWVGTDSQGIVEIETAGMQTGRIYNDPFLPNSLGRGALFAIYRDRAGLVWIGTDSTFGYHNASQTAVSIIFGGSSRSDGVSAHDIAAILEMPDGKFWLGLGNNGIDVIDPNGARVAALRPDTQHPQTALPRKFVTALAPGIDSDVYIGTRRGLYRADSAARAVARVTVGQRPSIEDVATLLLHEGVLWIGGSSGLRGLDLAGGNAERIAFATASGLTDQRISTIRPESDHSLWVGTENGLNRIDLANRTVERFVNDSAGPEGHPVGFVSALLTDAQGRLWISTLGTGISVVKLEAGKLSRVKYIGTGEGLRSGIVDHMLQDANGRMWASTDDGIAVIDPETFAVRVLRFAEGAAIQGHWLAAGARTSHGELLFGGSGGLTLIRPDRLEPWNFRPPVVVTSVRLGGKLISESRFDPSAASNVLTVSPDANSLAIEFAALEYSAPERAQYAYQLEGFDRDWVEADRNQRVAAYTNLSPGDYLLRLRGSNRDGLWTETTLSMPIRVLPAWFETTAFRFVMILAAGGLIAMLMHVRTTYLRRRQRDLERQIADRTASLKQRTEELQESQRQLEVIAYFDVLTKLPNRRRFRDEMSRLIARMQNEGGSFALLLIDLDRFKQINDTLGHEAGDQLLQQAAIRFKSCVGDGDTVARLGGDEFVVLLPHVDAIQRAAGVAQSILSKIAEPFVLVGHDFRVTGSVGICTYPVDGRDEQTLMKHADLAMYHAKAEGKNNFQFYSGALDTNSLERLSLESGLRHALEHGEFQLHYQAKRDIESGRMSGVEALLCWQHPQMGMVAPTQFLPVADETGLIVPIGKWALRTACSQNVAWQKLGLPRLSIAVNLTARQFYDDQLLNDVALILEETGMEPSLLELEIAESLMIRDVERTVRTLTALKAMGVRIAIDDFGAGYSSLTTLQRFPLDTIKIDRSFISGITSADADNTLTDAVIAMGRSLSLTVVAQGVETRDQAECLRKQACDELQGFYFNRPLPAEQFGQLLHAQAAVITYVGERAALRE